MKATKKSKKKTSKKRAPKKPYTGGVSWHPDGMVPGGRRAPTPRRIADEQW